MFFEHKSARWMLFFSIMSKKYLQGFSFHSLCQYLQWPQLQLSQFSQLIWNNKAHVQYWSLEVEQLIIKNANMCKFWPTMLSQKCMQAFVQYLFESIVCHIYC